VHPSGPVITCIVALCMSCSPGCGAHDPRPSTPASGGDERASIDSDTEMACARTRSAGAWTQLVYQSATWRRLAERADGREAAAWNEIGDLVERNIDEVEGSVCTDEMLSNIRASAARLSGPP
jgi:hypothetical protein